MPTEYVDVVFRAQLANIEQELAKLPGSTDKQARAVLRTLNRMARQADREYRDIARSALDAAERKEKAFEGVKLAAEGLGGAIGETAGIVEKMVQSSQALGAALGPTGAMIGAATVGLGLLAAGAGAAGYALVSLVNSADEAIDRLREIEGTEPVSQAALEALDDYEQATLGLEAAALELRVALAEDLAPALTTVVDSVSAAVRVTTALYRGMQEASEAVTGAGLGTNALRLSVTATLGPVAGLMMKVADWTGASDRLSDALAMARDHLVDTADATDELAAAASGAVAEWDRLIASMGVDPTEARIREQQAALEETFELAARAKIATGEWTQLDLQMQRQNLGLQLARIRAEAEAERTAAEHREAEQRHREWQRRQEQERAEEARAEAERTRAQIDAERLLVELRKDALSAEDIAHQAAEQRATAIAELAARGADEALVEVLHRENLAQLEQDLEAAARERGRAEQQAHLARVRAEVEALDLLEHMGAELNEQVATEIRLRAEYEARKVAIEELAAAGLDASAVAQLNLRNELELTEKLAEAERDRLDVWRQLGDAAQSAMAEMGKAAQQFAAAAGPVLDVVEQGAELRIERLRSEYEALVENHETNLAAKQDELDAELEAGKISRAEYDARMARLQQWDAAQRASIEAHKRQLEDAALKAFEVEQAAAVSRLIIQGVINAAALTPAFAYAGVAAPFIAAGIAAAQTAIGIGTVLASPPPEFPMGGLVGERFEVSADHRLIAARDDEGIVSPRGMHVLGPDGLDALNEGRMPFAGTVLLQLDRRTIAEAVIDATGRTRIRPARGRILGRVPVYGRG